MFVTHTARATRFLSIVLISGVLAACGGDNKPLATVDQVDLQRYAGTWYEIARLPQWFQRGCYDSTATYSLNDDDTVKVVNRCQREGDEASGEGLEPSLEANGQYAGVVALVADPHEAIAEPLYSAEERMVVEAGVFDRDDLLDFGQPFE